MLLGRGGSKTFLDHSERDSPKALLCLYVSPWAWHAASSRSGPLVAGAGSHSGQGKQALLRHSPLHLRSQVCPEKVAVMLACQLVHSSSPCQLAVCPGKLLYQPVSLVKMAWAILMVPARVGDLLINVSLRPWFNLASCILPGRPRCKALTTWAAELNEQEDWHPSAC